MLLFRFLTVAKPILAVMTMVCIRKLMNTAALEKIAHIIQCQYVRLYIRGLGQRIACSNYKLHNNLVILSLIEYC